MDIAYLCPRAAKKRFGKVRKYQFCGQLKLYALESV